MNDNLLATEAAIRQAHFVHLTAEQRAVAYVVADWVHIVLAEHGVALFGQRPDSWPSHADVDHSWLLNRLLQGIKPLPLGDERAQGLWRNGLAE